MFPVSCWANWHLPSTGRSGKKEEEGWLLSVSPGLHQDPCVTHRHVPRQRAPQPVGRHRLLAGVQNKKAQGAQGYHLPVVWGFEWQIFSKEQPNNCSEPDARGRALFSFIYNGRWRQDIPLASSHDTLSPLPITCQIDHFYNTPFSPSFFTSHCTFPGSRPYGKHL